jgi:DNA invertase Pin-like site-specific DNA recombinase
MIFLDACFPKKTSFFRAVSVSVDSFRHGWRQGFFLSKGGVMGAVYAYLRVSTDAQDVANQKHGVLEYANGRGLANLRFVEDSVSGKTPWQERKVGELLHGCQEGDTVIFAEISRMARSTLQVLEIVKFCVERGINVHIAKQQMTLDGSMQSKITATVLGLAAEIEREFISMRTKEALSKRKAEGVILGRPKGPAPHVRLDDRAQEIRGYLDKGLGKRAIARLVDCSPSTLYDWLERRGVVRAGGR